MKKHSLVLVDVSHLGYLYSSIDTVMTARYNGMVVDTRIVSGIVKSIWKWTHSGTDDVVVCFDNAIPSRRAYVEDKFGTPYKPGRNHNSVVREGLDLTREILTKGNVNMLSVRDFEADDLVQACITKFHDSYEQIHVITGDFDLVPLVDDVVSVHLRSRKMRYAADRVFATGYYELTPDTYSDITTNWSKFTGWDIPYNAILLQKMLYGDESDGLPGIMTQTSTGKMRRLYTKSKFNKLVGQMEADGVDFSKTFRYANRIPDAMIEVLETYFPEEVVPEFAPRYYAMDLNSGYPGRNPIGLNGQLLPLGGDFYKAVSELNIKIV